LLACRMGRVGITAARRLCCLGRTTRSPLITRKSSTKLGTIPTAGRFQVACILGSRHGPVAFACAPQQSVQAHGQNEPSLSAFVEAVFQPQGGRVTPRFSGVARAPS